MEPDEGYYERRERKNGELVVTMGWAIAFTFGLGVLYLAGRLILAVVRWIF